MKFSINELIREGLRIIVLLVLCAVAVDVTQMIAMITIVGVHECSHAIVGVANGETLNGLPSIYINGVTPVSIRGNTQFTDNVHAKVTRVLAGPFANLLMGILLSMVLIKGRGYDWLKSGARMGYVAEALTLVLFWSGFAIVTQFTGENGTDLGSLSPTLAAQIFEAFAVLFGMSIMVLIIYGRAKKYLLKTKIIHMDQGNVSKRPMWLGFLVCLLVSIVIMLIAPVIIGMMLGWLFMALTMVYYVLLLLDDNLNFTRIGEDLNYFGLLSKVKGG